MNRSHRIALFVAIAAMAPISATASRIWLLDTEYNEFRVVVSPRATVSELRAAAEFQDRWEERTGYRPEAGPEPVLGMVNVWIGVTDNLMLGGIRVDKLGDSGFHIRTYDHSWRKRIRDHFGVRTSLHIEERYALVIAGGPEGGTEGGVRSFFDLYMGDGLRPPESLPKIDDRVVPRRAEREERAELDTPQSEAVGPDSPAEPLELLDETAPAPAE